MLLQCVHVFAEDCSYYQSRANSLRQDANVNRQNGNKVGGPNGTFGPQYYDAAQAQLNAASQYDAKYQACMSGNSNGTANSDPKGIAAMSPQERNMVAIRNELQKLQNVMQLQNQLDRNREAEVSRYKELLDQLTELSRQQGNISSNTSYNKGLHSKNVFSSSEEARKVDLEDIELDSTENNISQNKKKLSNSVCVPKELNFPADNSNPECRWVDIVTDVEPDNQSNNNLRSRSSGSGSVDLTDTGDPLWDEMVKRNMPSNTLEAPQIDSNKKMDKKNSSPTQSKDNNTPHSCNVSQIQCSSWDGSQSLCCAPGDGCAMYNDDPSYVACISANSSLMKYTKHIGNGTRK
jgi:hypothetical protein